MVFVRVSYMGHSSFFAGRTVKDVVEDHQSFRRSDESTPPSYKEVSVEEVRSHGFPYFEYAVRGVQSERCDSYLIGCVHEDCQCRPRTNV